MQRMLDLSRFSASFVISMYCLLTTLSLILGLSRIDSQTYRFIGKWWVSMELYRMVRGCFGMDGDKGEVENYANLDIL